MMTKVVYFNKYDDRNAYHWEECNRRAPNYNPPLEARYEVVAREVRKLAPAGRILDVGCGDAYLVAQTSEFANEIIGIDSEPRAVELANQLLHDRRNCSVIHGDCYHLPFEDSSFDVVLLTDVIEHLKDPGACLDSIRRVLRPTGVLILTTPKWRPDRMWDDRHEKEYKEAELKELLEKAFYQVTISYFWPIRWSNYYSTRIGWKACKYLTRYVFNPFLRESFVNGDQYGQLKACCTKPR